MTATLPNHAMSFTPGTPLLESALGRAFASACRQDGADIERGLRDATTRFVERLRADGVPPERVIVALKDALARYGGCHTRLSLHDDERVVDGWQARTYRRVFFWCLETYYQDTVPPA